MATAITGAAGAGLGSLAAGTFGWTAATWSQLGWTAGVLVGTYLFAPDGPDIVNEGSRLDDLNVTTSTYGSDIPKVYGSYRISGNIIWALPLSETRHEERQESGKGGSGSSSTNIWYTYAATFAVALCEGPISGIKKIWFGSKLVYQNGSSNYYNNITIYTGTQIQNIDWRIQSDKPDTPAYRNICYIVFNDIQLEDYGNIIPNVTCEVEGSINILSDICNDISLLCGLKASDLNYSAGTDIISGYVRTKNMSPRAAMEPLLSAYDYAIIENNSKLELIKQQQNSIVNIPEDELGANSDQKIEYNISQELDLIKRLTVKYANNQSDYQVSVQSIRRIDVKAENEIIVELPLALTDSHAKQLAEKNLYKNWLMRQSFSFSLPFTYNYLVASNIITINFDGYKKDVRLTKITVTEDNILQCNAIAENYGVYSSNAIGGDTNGNTTPLSTGPIYNGTITSITTQTNISDSNRSEVDDYFNKLKIIFTSGDNLNKSVRILNYIASTGTFELDPTDVSNLTDFYGVPTPILIGDTYNIYNDTFFTLLDCPTLNNSLINSEVIYCGATGINDSWKGCQILSKTYDLDDFSIDETLIGSTIQGDVNTILGNGKINVWDRDNSVTVTPYYGTIDSFSENLLLNGLNYCIIGNEILQFSLSTDNLDGTFTLSNLLRGRRGTESFVGTHTSNEKFMLLNNLTMGSISKQIGSTNKYSALTIGLPISTTKDTIDFNYTGKNLKPFSPYYFRAERSGNNVNLQWMRRSRYISGYFKTLPMVESVEKYTLEIYDNTDTLIRTITDILTSNYIYDITLDSLLASDELRFYVYQISNIVGKGYPSDYLILEGV